MAHRARSLATRVTASLAATIQPSSSSAETDSGDETNIRKPSIKRIESFTSHIRRFSITSPIKPHSPDENASSPRTPESPTTVETAQQEKIAYANEAATNQYFTFDVKHTQPRITVLGPGGVIIPQVHRLKRLVPNGTVAMMCLTWNVASRSQNHLSKIRKLIRSERPVDRPDLICICFQELPPTNTHYHQETVKLLTESIADTHLLFCWVRKWSQMMIVFIRDPLVAYASTPEWQFISSTAIVKPVRTKGAIAVYFRLFQASVIFVTCHMTPVRNAKENASDGSVLNRIYDYTKICDSLRFRTLRRLNSPPMSGVKQADCVFWFGDLNFRLRSREQVDELSAQNSKQSILDSYFAQLLIDDELTLERCKGSIFEGFSEAYINFPPTHKFVLGTNDYASDRIPSYTDRILYYAKDSSRICPVKYDCLWEENSSDHKPVYGLFTSAILRSEKRPRKVVLIAYLNEFETWDNTTLRVYAVAETFQVDYTAPMIISEIQNAILPFSSDNSYLKGDVSKQKISALLGELIDTIKSRSMEKAEDRQNQMPNVSIVVICGTYLISIFLRNITLTMLYKVPLTNQYQRYLVYTENYEVLERSMELDKERETVRAFSHKVREKDVRFFMFTKESLRALLEGTQSRTCSGNLQSTHELFMKVVRRSSHWTFAKMLSQGFV